MLLPITDLHCDLLLYLALTPGAHIEATADIGVTLPYLRQGNVRHQAMAIFARTDTQSTDWFEKQLIAYQQLLASTDFHAKITVDDSAVADESIGITLALENASVLATETEPLNKAFERLAHCLEVAERLFYITLTHHTENRFGGGNYTDVGLKADGEALLEVMAQQGIPVDLSHTSDALASDTLNYIDKQNLALPVLASHSNFRTLRDHPRNLTDEFVQEIIRRDGLIGANFLRLFLDGARPESLLEHIMYGLEQAPKQMAFGADFFYRPGISDPDRQPLFFPASEDAGRYPSILAQLAEQSIAPQQLQGLAFANTERFIAQHW